MKLHAGIDIGGQSIKGIALDEEGALRAEALRRTPARSGSEDVLSAIAEVIGELRKCGSLVSVGVGTPGGVDEDGVIVGMAANIAGWHGTKLGERIAALAGAPCGVRNDGNLAAYAEWAIRGGASRALFFMGLGTGIGGGFVENGRILAGCDERAVEIGHVVVEPSGRHCVCGIDGCAEAFASGPSIGRIATDLALGRDAGIGSLASRAGIVPDESLLSGSGLAAMAKNGEPLNALEVYQAFARGDRLAVLVDAIAAEALSRAAATGLAMFAPDTLVLGGGVVAGAPHLVRHIESRMRELIYPDGWKHCRFEAAVLSHRAGLLGAALYGAGLVDSREALFALARKARSAD